MACNNPTRPIVIAGGGCVGLYLALLLSQSAIPNPVIVIEPEAPSASTTRAMAHQPHVFPLFARVEGLLEELGRVGSFSSGLCFRTSVENGSKMIAGKEFGEGEKGQLLLPQGKFQEVLLNRLRDSKGEVRLGWEVLAFEQRGEGVTVQLKNVESGQEDTISAAYLIGADGAHSVVRKGLGFSLEGDTLDFQLVATDLVFDFHQNGFYDGNFIVDTHDHGLIGRIDDEGLWRVSYGVPTTMSEEQIREGVHEKLSKMLPNAGLDPEGKRAYDLKSIAPYKAQQRCADAFWDGKVGVVGDAAHLTNPYAGLGLACGIADAASLADVLVRILTSQSGTPEVLLRSWSNSRIRKFLQAVDGPSRAGYARVKNKVDTEEEMKAFMEKDPLVNALKKGLPMRPPTLETKGEELEAWYP